RLPRRLDVGFIFEALQELQFVHGHERCHALPVAFQDEPFAALGHAAQRVGQVARDINNAHAVGMHGLVSETAAATCRIRIIVVLVEACQARPWMYSCITWIVTSWSWARCALRSPIETRPSR